MLNIILLVVGLRASAQPTVYKKQEVRISTTYLNYSPIWFAHQIVHNPLGKQNNNMSS